MSNVSKSPAPTRANTPSTRHPEGAADAREQQGQQQEKPAGTPAHAPRGPRGDERRGDARQP
ncbi:hypothetical protein, partial [Burkholderia metallica]|uniref:hypothetical protein n=1 Tax=Burkholderia metallica TaxID=488729 RepID=UPI001A8DCA7B